jgi:hypothetical protein
MRAKAAGIERRFHDEHWDCGKGTLQHQLPPNTIVIAVATPS